MTIKCDFSQCAEQFGIKYSDVLNCVTGPLGNALEHEMAEKTNALKPPHQYVPWVTLYGVSFKFIFPSVALNYYWGISANKDKYLYYFEFIYSRILQGTIVFSFWIHLLVLHLCLPTFTPYCHFIQVHTEKIQKEAQNDLKKLICDNYKV